MRTLASEGTSAFNLAHERSHKATYLAAERQRWLFEKIFIVVEKPFSRHSSRPQTIWTFYFLKTCWIYNCLPIINYVPQVRYKLVFWHILFKAPEQCVVTQRTVSNVKNADISMFCVTTHRDWDNSQIWLVTFDPWENWILWRIVVFIGIIGRKFIVFHSRNSSESAIPMICLLVFLSSVNILLHFSKYKISFDSQANKSCSGSHLLVTVLWIPRVARAVLSLMLTPKDYSMQSVERETEKPKNNNCGFPQDLLWMLSSRAKFGKKGENSAFARSLTRAAALKAGKQKIQQCGKFLRL